MLVRNGTIFQGQRLSELALRPVTRDEQARYQAQTAQHHYPGDLAKIGETLWYVATWREMRQLTFQPRRVLDYLRLTANSLGALGRQDENKFAVIGRMIELHATPNFL